MTFMMPWPFFTWATGLAEAGGACGRGEEEMLLSDIRHSYWY